MIENLLNGAAMVLTGQGILVIIIGAFVGYLAGSLPGITSSVGVALLIPFTFGMNPAFGLIMLVAIYQSSLYGDSIPAILVNIPGTPAAVCVAIDGFELSKQGQSLKALSASLISSALGCLLSTIVTIFSSVSLAHFALRFGPPEYFALGILGLTVVGALSEANMLKGYIMAAVGLLITSIGLDPITAYPRYVITVYLMDGIEYVPALLGLFAISEVLAMFEKSKVLRRVTAEKTQGSIISLREIRGLGSNLLWSSLIGYIVGVIPGAGGVVGSFLAYGEAKRRSKTPELFGKGALEGVVAADSANNAAAAGALVPTLSLGIPGSSTAAVLLGGLMVMGITPGPFLFRDHPEIVYSLFVSLIVGVPIMLLMGVAGIQLWVKAVQIPTKILGPVILGFSILGSYAISRNMSSVWITLIFGIAGYIAKKTGYPVAPMVLAMILGPMVERNFRRGLIMGGGSPLIFFTRPLTLIIIGLAIFSIMYPYIRRRKRVTVSKGA